ncbi:hypothetical protein AA101099_2682 [Neoasaia chiangmaiensis NBRC 101099]|nr:hypothetical protein [Neoasaia chiangmaiensis]GBR41939.1 hypothetical protein AA101099_2682 [Neoasaia chiangmaiensis NBRC 101099]GEN14240.1 hypothetical protein NCH01_06710 [Neoasaia chiangmaiensis]
MCDNRIPLPSPDSFEQPAKPLFHPSINFELEDCYAPRQVFLSQYSGDSGQEPDLG